MTSELKITVIPYFIYPLRKGTTPLGNRLEVLKGDRAGQYSIRINDQYRVCFTWHDEPGNVEIVDYH